MSLTNHLCTGGFNAMGMATNYEYLNNVIMQQSPGWSNVVTQQYYQIPLPAPPDRTRREKLLLLTIKTILT